MLTNKRARIEEAAHTPFSFSTSYTSSYTSLASSSNCINHDAQGFHQPLDLSYVPIDFDSRRTAIPTTVLYKHSSAVKLAGRDIHATKSTTRKRTHHHAEGDDAALGDAATNASAETDRDDRIIYVMIPGNPGVPHFYRPFLNHLYHHSGRTLDLCVVSHAGHGRVGIDNTHDTKHDVYTLAEQVNHKLSFLILLIRKYPSAKLILAGHSVGAYVCTELLRLVHARRRPSELQKHNSFYPQRRDLVHLREALLQTQCLFPTIQSIGVSPNAAIMTPLFEFFPRLVLSHLALGLSVLPEWAQKMIARPLLGTVDPSVMLRSHAERSSSSSSSRGSDGDNDQKEVSGVTSDAENSLDSVPKILNYHSLQCALYMAKEEMALMGELKQETIHVFQRLCTAVGGGHGGEEEEEDVDDGAYEDCKDPPEVERTFKEKKEKERAGNAYTLPQCATDRKLVFYCGHSCADGWAPAFLVNRMLRQCPFLKAASSRAIGDGLGHEDGDELGTGKVVGIRNSHRGRSRRASAATETVSNRRVSTGSASSHPRAAPSIGAMQACVPYFDPNDQGPTETVGHADTAGEAARHPSHPGVIVNNVVDPSGRPMVGLPQVILDEEKVPHGFVTGHSDVVAEKVWQLMQGFVLPSPEPV